VLIELPHGGVLICHRCCSFEQDEVPVVLVDVAVRVESRVEERDMKRGRAVLCCAVL